ncbi:MAG: hypothetical protein A2633_00665 [Candidatus Sungbacteria bacterium RIFCSPHIGHO2_01_FULL_47_32]|uniref:Uncharacterized protein n=1 Tax=Candidatus Sungbacteria bacterium RIFCSPHIGHO2_01_FULL_47_32 TaxID=1802264 RepID=A0A1G2K628_9BACT|nr:MAG: hypothetical protein A2633_00665 [Candidatus Sungbacteria bacterium RIFCSPHIGHO2_01_FULL_47_32]
MFQRIIQYIFEKIKLNLRIVIKKDGSKPVVRRNYFFSFFALQLSHVPCMIGLFGFGHLHWTIIAPHEQTSLKWTSTGLSSHVVVRVRTLYIIILHNFNVKLFLNCV